MDKQDQIIQKHWINPLDIANTGQQPKAIKKMMDDWAKEVLLTVMKGEYDFSCYGYYDNIEAARDELYKEFVADINK